MKSLLVALALLTPATVQAQELVKEKPHAVDFLGVTLNGDHFFECQPLLVGADYFVSNCTLTYTVPDPNPKAAAAGEVVVIETRIGCQLHGNGTVAECEEQITEGAPRTAEAFLTVCSDGATRVPALQFAGEAALMGACPEVAP